MRVCFFSLGCDKNKTDLEKVLCYLLKNYDIELVGEPKDADIAIVNTCSFIRDAKDESISTIKMLENIKKKTGLKVLVMGCLTKDESIDLSKILKNDDVVLSIDKYLSDLYNVDDRIMNILSFSSSLKISDGCDKNCSYCIIPKLRGSYKSNTIENIYNEAKKLVDGGARELNIVAQDTLNYGIDLYHKRSIVRLVERLSSIDRLRWIRLLYCYPEEIDDDVINLIKTNKKVLHYIDMPLQHINNDILKSMHRPTTKEKVVSLIGKLRKEIPDIIIRTTFIVGYPGETKREYDELIDFIKEMKLDKVGAFAYSREKNTLAYNLKNQVSDDIKKKRLKNLLDVQHDIVIEKKKSYIGNIYNCLIEGYDTRSGMYVARSYMDSRDIDEVIYIDNRSGHNARDLVSGSFVNVKITDMIDIDLMGVAI